MGEFGDIERRVAPKVYVGGSRSQIDFSDKFSIIEIKDIVKQVGCKPFSKCWFKVPSLELCGGLRLLEKDRDILDMMKWVPAYRMLEVYLEDDKTEGGGVVGGDEIEVEETMGFDDEAEENEIRDKMMREPGPLCPKIHERLDKIQKESTNYIVRWGGRYEFQVSGPNVQFTINLMDRTCACRIWQLSGISCHHAVAAILNQCDDPVKFVDAWFYKDRYLRTYSNLISPINGVDLWPESSKTPLLEPFIETQPGRHKKKRRPEAGEKRNDVKLGKNKGFITCTKCGNIGHNRRTCKGQSNRSGSSSRAAKKPRNGSAVNQETQNLSQSIPTSSV